MVLGLSLLDGSRRRLRYIGRPESASPAAGPYKMHEKEQKDIAESSFAEARVAPVRKVRVVRPRKSK